MPDLDLCQPFPQVTQFNKLQKYPGTFQWKIFANMSHGIAWTCQSRHWNHCQRHGGGEIAGKLEAEQIQSAQKSCNCPENQLFYKYFMHLSCNGVLFEIAVGLEILDGVLSMQQRIFSTPMPIYIIFVISFSAKFYLLQITWKYTYTNLSHKMRKPCKFL